MIGVLLVDDDQLVRSMLRIILDPADDITVVAEASDGAEAVTRARQHRPDVALMDIRMPGTDGLAATTELIRLPTPPKVVVLTTFDLDEYVHTALSNGAVGFLLKDASSEEMLSAIRAAAAGDAVLAPRITRRLLTTFAAPASTRRTRALQRLDVLTDKEREILTALAHGHANADIAKHLYLSEATVKTHVSRILGKLRLTNRVQAALLAYQAGLID